jgi:rhodanese-related sulfurtransferase
VSEAEKELSPQQVAEMVEEGAQVVDVREDREWDAGRIAGSLHIELNELTGRAEEIERERTVVFVCRTGNRSGMAADAFGQGGWDAHNMAGGLVAWVEAGLSLEPADGEVLDRKGRPAE